MDANQIIELLNEKAESFCEWLYPEGVRKGKEWCVGSLAGEAGASLKICLEGEKTGVWSDFATGEEIKGGNLVALLMRKRGTTVWHKSLFEAKEWLGLPVGDDEDRFYRQRERNHGKFETAALDFVALDPNGPVFRYLTEKRGLSPATIATYRIRQHKASAAMAFCQASPDNKSVAFVKYVDVNRAAGGKKTEWVDPKGGRPGLWGKHAIDEEENEIVISEGEIDCVSLAEIGVSAVSVPMGAGNHDWIEVDWKWLERFTEITLLFDNDVAGEKGASEAIQKLINRLGRARCRLAALPDGVKDANDAILQKRGTELATAISQAKSFDPAELKSVSEFRQQTKELFFPTKDQTNGKTFFIPTDFIRTRPGEVSLWTGINSHGKSSALLHNMIHLAAQGERVLIACMEASAQQTARILCRQAHAGYIDTEKDFNVAWDAIEPWFWIYDSQDVVKREEIMSTFEYAFRRYGVTQFMIDSFMTLDLSKDDYNAQSRMMDSLRLFAIRLNVHVHLVAHSRKGKDESERPGKMDVSGHADITNKAFNGYTIWRNVEKEHKLADALETNAEALHAKILIEEHDAELICWKQRQTGHQPIFKLWFDRAALQFAPKGTIARRYLLPPKPTVYATRPVTDADFE